MKSKHFITGVLFLFAGVVALLAVLGVFTFHWTIVWRLWPIMLIIFGITLLPLKDYLKGILVLVALGAGCALYHFEAQNYEGNPIRRFYNTVKSWSYNSDTDEEVDEEEEYSFGQHFSEPYYDIDTASIEIDFGAGDLTLKAPCAELVKVDAESNFVKYEFQAETNDNKSVILVGGKGHTKHIGKKNENDLEIALCAQPLWSFSLDMGAADADLDFTPYKVSSIEINGGACDLDLALGDSGCDTKVTIKTGASDIDIRVPKEVDCQVNLKSAISGKDFTGFQKIEKGLWQTPDFGQGAHQIVIDLSCAVSDISVERY